jgi:hypothetical protein
MAGDRDQALNVALAQIEKQFGKGCSSATDPAPRSR